MMAGARRKLLLPIAVFLLVLIPGGVSPAPRYPEDFPTILRDRIVDMPSPGAERQALKRVASDMSTKDDVEITVSGDRIAIRGAIESRTVRDGATVTIRLMHPVYETTLRETSATLQLDKKFATEFSAGDLILDLVRIGAIPIAVSVNENGRQRSRFVEPGRKKWNLVLDRRKPYPRPDNSGLLISGRLHTQHDFTDFQLNLVVRDTMNPDPKAHRQVIPVKIQSDGTFRHATGGGGNFIRLYHEGKSKISIQLEYRGTMIESETYP